MRNPQLCDLVVTPWSARFKGRRFSCSIGRGGIGTKGCEGDGITPVGIWKLMTVLHRPEREEAVNSMSIGLNDLWSDDVNDDEYNHHVVATDYPYSHEKLRRSDRIYDLIGVTNFNWPVAKLGAGSAIFLHVWRRPRFPTEGCVAFARDDLRWILSNWESGSRIVIAGSSACRK